MEEGTELRGAFQPKDRGRRPGVSGLRSMLSLESLLEEAKTNGLPLVKTRGVLGEYLQVIILNGIYKHPFGKFLFFTGGTALRFFYGLPRFSEDLDFDSPKLSLKDFREILEAARKGLLKEGFSAKVDIEKRGRLYLAQFEFKDLMRLYGITDQRGLDLMVKIDVYQPRWKLRSESDVLSLYGHHFSAVLLEKGCVFSEKLFALFNRRRGRDIYDTLFMLKKKFPFDKGVLAAQEITGSPGEVILRYLEHLPEKELKALALQVKPFLFKEEEAELVVKAPLYAKRFLE